MLNLGGSQKATVYVFGQKGYNSMAKRVQFNTNRKKGTPLVLGPEKDIQQLTYVVQNKKSGESPFLASPPKLNYT